jgi:hypothetical protein
MMSGVLLIYDIDDHVMQGLNRHNVAQDKAATDPRPAGVRHNGGHGL